jgi:hypothetical protein
MNMWRRNKLFYWIKIVENDVGGKNKFFYFLSVKKNESHYLIF